MNPSQRQSAHPFQRLFQYSRRYKSLMAQATACSVLNKIFDLAPPALIGAAVDVVVEQEDSLIARFGIQSVSQQLLLLTVLSAVVWSLESLFQYLYAYLWRNLAQNIEHDLRLEAYAHIQELEMAYFEERSTGGLMAILNDDVNQLERFLDVGANEVLQVIVTVLLIGGAFFWLAPGVAWLSMLPMPVILAGSINFQKRLAPRYADVRERVSLLSSRLANNLSGMTTIKSFATEAYEVERLGEESEGYRQSNRRAITLSAAFIPLIRFIILLGFVGTLLLGGLAAVEGQITVGTYSVMVFLTQRLLWPLTRLGETLDQYQRAMASTQRVMDLLDTPLAIRSGHRPFQAVKGGIQLQNITFGYADQRPVMQDLSLTIPAGQTIAIVGSTGSGKSTLVKLLLRLYDIQAGAILFDDLDSRELNLQDLRRAIGLVSQDVFLFHGSVRENIAYGSPDATQDDIVRAAEIAEAHEFIQALPKGYDTIVGERGQKLSGGQRQRIAIARAILKDPPILILDEATSAVDNETEAAIQRSLEKITQHRTTIAIAHRLSTVRNADRIYVMEQGQWAESGSHEELLALNGIYAALWCVQTGIRGATVA